MDLISTVLVTVLTVCIGLWIWKRYRNFQHFKSLGVPGPSPNFWTGNLADVTSKGVERAFHEWGKTYGPFYGVYFGVIPTFITTDIELVKRITVSEFRNFVNRSLVIPTVSNGASDFLYEPMSLKKGRAWKESRKILSHIVSPAKMKKMTQLTQPAIDQFLKDGLQKCTSDVRAALKSLTLEMMCRSMLGLESTGVGPVERVLKEFTEEFFFTTPIKMLMIFPETATLFSIMARLNEWRGHSSNAVLINIVQQVIDQRKANPQAAVLRKDIIQIMLDTQKDQSEEEKLSLTDCEIVANIVEFMFGGYDTMGLTLNTAIFHLAKDPKCQELCRNEALQCQDLNSYDELAKLPLLEGAIKESIRLYTSGGIVFNRVAEVDVTHQQWNIPKGSIIVVPSLEIHKDPEIWEDPEVFNPERHLENKEEFMGFGLGPRICLAARLAPMLLKQVLGRILVSFEMRLSPGASEKLDLEYGAFTARITNPIQIEVTPLK